MPYKTSTGTEDKEKKRGRGAQFTTAEKNGKRMALKSFTGAKPFLKTHIKPFDHGNGDAS
jgi:hypothetical protein